MSEERRRPGPVLIELDAEAAAKNPAEAPPVPELAVELPQGRAMQIAARLAARPASRVTKFFWRAGAALFGFILSVTAWQALAALMAAHPVIGWIGTALTLAFALAALLVAAREIAAFARLRRLDGVHRAVLEAGDLKAAQGALGQLRALYSGRPELEWALARLKDRAGEEVDAGTLLEVAEAELMAPLDQAARLEIEAAARQVAMVTALVPLALADVVAALAANLRMIRRLGEIYGGRTGAMGGLRLARSVMTHLVATGAVAVGDDLIHTMAGGGALAKLSRRFGEGLVNGALTARVGIAAMEVCRPMPFRALPRPRVSAVVGRALSGLFPGGKDADQRSTD